MSDQKPRELFVRAPDGHYETGYVSETEVVVGQVLYVEKSAYDKLKELHCFHKGMLDESSIMLIEKNEQLFKLKARIDKLIKALEWYANGGGMTYPTCKIVDQRDAVHAIEIMMEISTKTAREALQEFDRETK